MKKLLATAAVLLMLAAPGHAKPMVIGVSMALFDDNFLTSVRQAMADTAKAMPDVEIQFQDAQGDIGRQISQVQNFMAQKVDAIVVNVVDTAATRNITKAVTDAGIPLVYVNRQPDAKTLPPKVSVVASDDLVAGRLEMTELARRMGGKGNVVLMLGDLANNSTQGRTAGNKEVLAKNPGMVVVEEQTANFERTRAIDLMNNWLSKGTEINAVAANNDEMAIGAIIALRQAGRSGKDVFVGGVDATADALAEMQKGGLAVTVFQDAKGQGRKAIENAVKLARGEKVEQFDFVPYELVTPENYKTFLNR